MSRPENEDVALAKILQQQERAFLELRGAPHLEEGPPPGLTEDEELAWRLMREEEAMFQHRMMALAGLEPAGSSGAAEVDSGSADEARSDHQDGDDDQRGERPDRLDNPARENRGGDRAVIASMDPENLTYEELTTLGDLAGTVSCGLTEEQVGRLVHSTYGELVEADRGRGDDPCVVCQLEFEAEDSAIKLPCSHVFHVECLRPWLSRSKKCPYCSVEVEGI
jgi:E3 ubiquitin-protein ligase BIG BROTHER-like protein